MRGKVPKIWGRKGKKNPTNFWGEKGGETPNLGRGKKNHKNFFGRKKPQFSEGKEGKKPQFLGEKARNLGGVKEKKKHDF